MWAATSELVPTEMAQGVDIVPEDLSSDIDSNYLDSWGLYGDFGYEDSYIYGWQDYGYTYSLSGYDGWGILNIKLGDENYYYNPEESTTWSGAMGGGGYYDYWLIELSGTW